MASLVGFAVLAYDAYKKNIQWQIIVYVALAVLLQPIVKVHFTKEVWNIIDVIIGCFLVVLLITERKKV